MCSLAEDGICVVVGASFPAVRMVQPHRWLLRHRSPLSGSSFITPEQVQAIAYPMGGSRQLANMGRYVLSDEEIAAAVCAAHACRAAGAGTEGATIQGTVMFVSNMNGE